MAVVALSAVAVAATLHPPLAVRLEDTRNFLTSGEWWRPLSGHLVHAGPLHLLLNLALFVPLGALRERRVGTTRFLLECLALAAFVAAGIRLLHWHWETYRGLSGVVYGLITVLLFGAPGGRDDGSGRSAASATRFGLAVVAVLAAKSALEYAGDGWLVGAGWLTSSLEVTYLPGSHCAGIVGGIFVALLPPLVTASRGRHGRRPGRSSESSESSKSPGAEEHEHERECARDAAVPFTPLT